MSFVLSERPWIPCERLDGRVVELSTHDVLVEAHQLRAIMDESPLVVAALHRHLLAVIHRVVDGPVSFKAWAAVYRRGAFDPDAVARYLERVRERLDLFHPTHPFAQVRGLTEVFPDSRDPIDQLGFERSSWGGARKLFQAREGGVTPKTAPAEAARLLLAHHAFATGGLVRKPGEPTSATAAPLVRSAVVVLRGATLFETLTSNLLYYAPEAGEPIAGTSNDAPAWEREPLPQRLPLKEEPKRLPTGWLDLLTWLSRRIELVREDEDVVSYVRAVGQGLDPQSPNDPMVTWRLDDKRGFVSIGIQPERAFWRDSAALFEAGRDAGRKLFRPKAVDQAASLDVREIAGDRAFTLEVSGLSAEKSKVDCVRVDRVWSRARYFDDLDVREVVTRALALAHSAADTLRGALRVFARHALSEGDRSPDGKDIGGLVSSMNAEPALWAALGTEFELLLRSIDQGLDVAAAEFAKSVDTHTRRAFERATSVADRSPRSLKARTKGESALHRGLQALAPRQPQRESHA
jgi:CRISPR system Cascade subunit CasA